jgi:hypothetical protein
MRFERIEFADFSTAAYVGVYRPHRTEPAHRRLARRTPSAAVACAPLRTDDATGLQPEPGPSVRLQPGRRLRRLALRRGGRPADGLDLPQTVDRLGINWAYLQPICTTSTQVGVCGGSSGAINWPFLDSLVATLGAHGIRILALIGSAPEWSWSLSDCGIYCNTTGNVTHCPLLCLHPDNTLEMAPADTPTGRGYPDPARDARLLCAIDGGVTAAGSSLPVLFGCLALNTTVPHSSYSIPDFRRAAVRDGDPTPAGQRPRVRLSALTRHARHPRVHRAHPRRG